MISILSKMYELRQKAGLPLPPPRRERRDVDAHKCLCFSA